jgi:hypothetical protein
MVINIGVIIWSSLNILSPSICENKFKERNINEGESQENWN